MTQSAVEWYSQQHLKLLIKLENKELSIGEYAVQHQEILHKAKEMEKQQIIDAFLKHRDSKFIHDQKINWQKSAEQYYNEKFENK
jgi:hypothetical protein